MVERVGEEMLEKVARESLDDGMVDKMRSLISDSTDLNHKC